MSYSRRAVITRAAVFGFALGRPCCWRLHAADSRPRRRWLFLSQEDYPFRRAPHAVATPVRLYWSCLTKADSLFPAASQGSTSQLLLLRGDDLDSRPPKNTARVLSFNHDLLLLLLPQRVPLPLNRTVAWYCFVRIRTGACSRLIVFKYASKIIKSSNAIRKSRYNLPARCSRSLQPNQIHSSLALYAAI